MSNWINLGSVQKTSITGYTATVDEFHANFDTISNFRATNEGSLITFTSGDTYNVTQTPAQLIALINPPSPT